MFHLYESALKTLHVFGFGNLPNESPKSLCAIIPGMLKGKHLKTNLCLNLFCMKSAMLYFLLFFSSSLKSQDNAGLASKRIDTIHSAILKEDRYIWVSSPCKHPAVSKCPVIYVLDGQILFDDVNKIRHRLSKETGREVANEMLVVGIGNIWQRYRDYSPTSVTSSPFVDSHSASISGGGEKFISFLEQELFPYIDTNYQVSPIRILIGHSMGGLQVMNILLKYPGMFHYYAAIDPSMWWDDQKLLSESKTILAEKTFENKTLFLAVANTKELDMDEAKIKIDTSMKTVLIRPGIALVDHINHNRINNLKFDWKFYKEYHHLTVTTPGIYDALRFFLTFL